MPVFINYLNHEYSADIINHSLEHLLTIKNSCSCNLSICIWCKTTFHNNIFRMIYYTRHVEKKYHLQILCYMVEYIMKCANYRSTYNRLLCSMFSEIFSQYNNPNATIDFALRKQIIEILLKHYTVFMNNE